MLQAPPDAIRVPLARWRVRLVVGGAAWVAAFGDSMCCDVLVWASCSTDATRRARELFFGDWATPADRAACLVRATQVLQEAT